MWTYTARNQSLVTDFRVAAKYLANHGVKAVVKGQTLKTDADPMLVSKAIRNGFVLGIR